MNLFNHSRIRNETEATDVQPHNINIGFQNKYKIMESQIKLSTKLTIKFLR